MVRSKTWPAALLLVFACLSYLTLVYMPRAALHGERYFINTSPAAVDLDFEPVALRSSDGIDLAAWWMPANEPVANLVFVHGHGSNRHSEYFGSLNFYRAAVESGLSVLAIDLRNHGASGADERGMQWGKTEAEDAVAAIAWLRQRSPDLPLLALGKSMGGATVIHAAARGAETDGLILVDPLLDTRSAFANGGWVATGLPAALFAPSAMAAVTFHGLPDGEDSALNLASTLDIPVLLLQDPEDPVTLARYARELASRNDKVILWEAPPLDAAGQAKVAWKGRWGSHVAVFELYPELTMQQINTFVEGVRTKHRASAETSRVDG